MIYVFFCKARKPSSSLHRHSFQISLKHLLITFLHKGFRMRLFFYSLLIITFPVLSLAMDQLPQSPKNSTSHNNQAPLTTLVRALSIGDLSCENQSRQQGQPALSRKVSLPKPIPGAKCAEYKTARSYSTTNCESSLSSSPVSSNGTPGTSPESDLRDTSHYRNLYYPYPGSTKVESYR